MVRGVRKLMNKLVLTELDLFIIIISNDITNNNRWDMSKADLIIHPVRLRILRVLDGEALTTQEIAEQLGDVYFVCVPASEAAAGWWYGGGGGYAAGEGYPGEDVPPGADGRVGSQ